MECWIDSGADYSHHQVEAKSSQHRCGQREVTGSTRGPVFRLIFCALIAPAFVALADEPKDPGSWLDVPVSWTRSIEEGVITATPGDLPAGASFLMLIDPPSSTDETIAASFERALTDLAPWRPVGSVEEVALESGWIFRYGIGVVELNGETYTAETAVARYDNLLVRFWVLADSDDTFNRYKDAIGTAISSAQDLTASTAISANAAPIGSGVATPLATDFGQGISGVYVGLERGLSASAGFGQGQRQIYNQSTGQFETSTTGMAPGVQTSIGDYNEVDILFPDGSYRRRLPTRGLESDLNWDRASFPSWWGHWSRQGDIIITDRGGYRTTYRVNGNELISERDRPWAKLPHVASMRIEGSFARADYRDANAPRLILYADGRYEDRGEFLRMIGSVFNLIVPNGETMVSQWSSREEQRALGAGSGEYRFSNYTLTLNDSDGRVWQFAVYLPPDTDAAKPRQLTLNGHLLLGD